METEDLDDWQLFPLLRQALLPWPFLCRQPRHKPISGWTSAASVSESALRGTIILRATTLTRTGIIPILITPPRITRRTTIRTAMGGKQLGDQHLSQTAALCR